MFLDQDIIPFSTHRFSIYKSDQGYFILDGNNSLVFDINTSTEEEIENQFNEFYNENQASCHHFIGEFRIDSNNHSPVVGCFYGFDFFTTNQIKESLKKLIGHIDSWQKIEGGIVKILMFYDLETLEPLKDQPSPDDFISFSVSEINSF